MKIKALFLFLLCFSALSSSAGGYGIASNEKDSQRYIPQNIELLSRLAYDATRFNDSADLCNSLYVAYQSMDALDRRLNSKNEKERDFAEAMKLLELSQCENSALNDTELRAKQAHLLAALEILQKHWGVVQTSTLEP